MIRFLVLCVLLIPTVVATDSQKFVDKPTVVFVCEHGSAKSVVAAAYFNNIAQQQDLQFHAISRGTTPDPELLPEVVKGLHEDGVSLQPDKPTKLAPEEASGALRVITFCELPRDIKTQNVEHWMVPPISEDYAKSRDAIVTKVQELIRRLKGVSK